MARALQQPSRTRLARSLGSRLVQGLRQKSSWFIENIVRARPDAVVRTEPRILRRQPRTARRNELHFAGRVQVAVARQELVISDIPAVDKITGVVLPSAPAQGKNPEVCSKADEDRRSRRRCFDVSLRSVQVVGEDQDSDTEDFGNPCSFAGEDSSVPSEYHTAVSHLTDLSGLGNCARPQFVDEASGIVFARICQGPDERSLPATGAFTGECSSTLDGSVPITPITQGSGTACPSLLTAPSLMLTLPTPQIAHSPVFVPRSPITLSKYVEATTPIRGCNLLAPLSPATSCASPSSSPAPSVPSCDRCCLGQLEIDGVVCRACEKQWLACKMWYQAHDGGRRRWLTEPYIKPAESTARVRAVMGSVLASSEYHGNTDEGGSATASTRGLGFGSSVSLKKEPPFKVLSTSSGSSGPRAHAGAGFAPRFGPRSSNSGLSSGVTQAWARTARAANRLSLVRRGSAIAEPDGAQGVQAVLRALCARSASVMLGLFPVFRDVRRSGSEAVLSRSASDGLSTTPWAARVGGHQRRPSSCNVDSGFSSGTGSTSELCSGSVGGILCSGSARSERSGRQGCVLSESRFVEHLV